MITNQIGKGCRIPAFILFALLVASTGVRAQVSNSNPTGPAGVFNGNITTGCSYDPLTGNATRSITDLVVTGSVGTYPLAFARTTNSRQVGDFGFGSAGGWRHSYSWDIDGSEDDWSNSSFHPTVYPVSFPDGRLIYFTASPSDPYFRGPPGVPERFQPLDTSSLRAYLILPDGGKIEFKATKHSECNGELIHPCRYTYSYQAQTIIDPYGIRTTLIYTDGNLSTIQEQAGRSIQISYTNTSWSGQTVIDHIQSSDGRIVQYHYAQTTYSAIPYTNLDYVVYPFEPALNLSPTAYYVYQAPNGPNPNGFPLLSSCDDPMYAGPMKKILYKYPASNADSGGDPWVPVAAGQILSENHPTAGMVSRLYIPSITGRNEVRGDGPSRRFEYETKNGVPVLWTYTDFQNQNHVSTISYDGNGYTSGFEDARHHYTSTQREPIIGALSVLTHPDPEQSTQRFGYQTADAAPYFLQIHGDERLVNGVNSNTYYTRDDATHRIMKIWYPDYDPNNLEADPREEFTYNDFGQIKTHTMTSGGVETFVYDENLPARGRLTSSYPPPTASDPNPQDHRTHYFYYTSGPQMDRLRQVVDPRGYSTTLEYNTRGQVTKVTHDQDGSYTQSAYNVDGTLAWTADENHPNASWNVSERTRYIYDDYKRVTSVTNPMNETTNLSYAPPNGAGSYSHTTGSVYRVASQMTKITTFDYDENFRRTMVRKGTESGDDDGGTWFGYDEVGNLTSVQDPRGKVTTFGYDERNRRSSMTDPVPTDFNGNSNRNSNGHTFDWEYDTRSNLIKETRADNLYHRMEYDPRSRVIDTYGFAGEHTHYQRDFAGNVVQMTDPKLPNPAICLFFYDALNRKTSAWYPMDATTVFRAETFGYDRAGNLALYRSPAGQYKHFDFADSYDSRNRLRHTAWNQSGRIASADWSLGQEVTTSYDNAGRLTSVTTNGSATAISFGYDDANRQTWEEQTLAGYPTRHVATDRDSDGNRADLVVTTNGTPNYSITFDYTQRNQLWHIYPAGTVPWVTYAYDLNGNMTKRQTVKDGVNDSTNIMDANGVSQYDALNRPTMWEQTGNAIVNEVLVHDSSFARSHFAYDKLSRLTGSWRDEQGGKGEWYGYHVTGSLTGVAYNADGVSTGTPQNATRTVDYYLTPDTLNRSVMNDSGEPSSYTPNALNQYTDMNGGALYYDGNFNLMWTGGFSAGYDADKRLTAIGSGEDYGQFVYDGLGRCLKRTIDWETTLIAYDGWKPIVEWDEWNNEKAWNIYGSGPDEILYRHDFARGDLRYHLDRMGNVAFLLDGDGDGIERYTYDAFGSPIVTDWDGNNARPYSWYGNRFMFTGREYFPEFGLYDFRNRMYHPVLGRFLQSDPIGFGGGDANLFRYCGGDPVNGSDPSGMLEKKAPGLKTPPPIRPYEPVNFGSNGYTPTGSLIPQQLYGIPNGSGFDLFAHDYINGTQSLGTFLLIGSAGTQSNGGGNSGGGGAQFISVALLFQSARSSEVDPNQSSTTEAFGDDELFAALDKAVLQAQNLPPGKDMVDFFKAMANFDTGFYHNVCYNYTGHVENMGGYWSGYEVNYIGVGAGFAAGGFSLGAMDNWILGYNYYQGYTNPMVQGKMAWAKVAFDYYSAGH